jgi:hypothetical protein
MLAHPELGGADIACRSCSNIVFRESRNLEEGARSLSLSSDARPVARPNRPYRVTF